MSNSRRQLLLAGAGLAAGLARPAFAQNAVEIKVSHYLPPMHYVHKELVRWADDLGEKSKGKLKVTIFPSGQMGPITRQYDLARTGVADISYFLHGAMPGRFPLTELAQLPYAFTVDTGAAEKTLNGAQASAIVTGMAGQLAKEHEGTRILYIIAAPTVSLFFSKAVVHLPADMKGMRLRHNGPLAAKMIEAWGATPASVAPVELADALEKGTVDGMTFNYEGAQAFQYGNVVRSVTELNGYAGTFALVMNAKKYESLPTDLRELIDASTGVEAARRVGATADTAEAAGRQYMLDHKVEILIPTAAETLAFKTPVMPIVKQTLDADEAKGLPARKFYDELRAQVNAVK